MWNKIYECLKEFFDAGKPFLRKLRIMRYMVCVVIIFIFICDSYWNVLTYINLPCAPLLAKSVRDFLRSSVVIIFILWLLFIMLFPKLYRYISMLCQNRHRDNGDNEDNGDKWKMIISYIQNLLNFFFTMYFIVYAVNKVIEYANGLPVHITVEVTVAFIYLIGCAFAKSILLHSINYERNKTISYTNFCDSTGTRIPVDAYVFYNGKSYFVEQKAKEKEDSVKQKEKVYVLSPCESLYESSMEIPLEDAASDMQGKLFVERESGDRE